uniref:Pancreatic trypsin inhibitor n=1 Tax=Rhipicephalus zambeziensis TaxID=60191 RepID=A0A224Y4L3_9ACAR
MALPRVVFILLMAISWAHAVPRYCQEPPVKGSCRALDQSWKFDCSTKKCVMVPKVLCSRGPNVFTAENTCLTAGQQFSAKKHPQGCPNMLFAGGCRPQNHQWYYDPRKKRCRAFHYRQCTTSGNHFPNERKCMETCLPGTIKTPPICQKPLVQGLCGSANKNWHYNSTLRTCVPFHNGQCGAGPNAFRSQHMCSMTCQKSGGKNQHHCLQKPQIGSCQQEGRAWYFDHYSGKCKMFIHGACGRGSNHFATESKCLEVCLARKKPLPVCSAEAKPGYCVSLNTKWYFDEKKNECFRYRGGWCAKTANGFLSYDVCMDHCSVSGKPENVPQSEGNQGAPTQQQQQEAKIPGS